MSHLRDHTQRMRQRRRDSEEILQRTARDAALAAAQVDPVTVAVQTYVAHRIRMSVI